MPLFGYNNILESATVTATAEAADFPVENCYDWLTYPSDVWKSTALGWSEIRIDAGSVVTADYFAFYNFIATSIWLQTTDAAWTATATPVQVDGLTDNKVIFKQFAQASSRYWKIAIYHASAIPVLGVVALGNSMAINESVQVGFSPPEMARIIST